MRRTWFLHTHKFQPNQYESDMTVCGERTVFTAKNSKNWAWRKEVWSSVLKRENEPLAEECLPVYSRYLYGCIVVAWILAELPATSEHSATVYIDW